jgi:hypothetical protein
MSESYLPASTPRYKYQGKEQCLSILEEEQDRYNGGRNPYVLFLAVDERSFLELANSQEDLLLHSCVSYNFASHTLLFRMESPAHASAASTFSSLIQMWSFQQQTLLVNKSTGSYRGAVGNQPQSKRGDFTFQPDEPPASRGDKWPTLAGEVAFSETRRQLEHDIQWWHTQGNDEVNVVLSITVHPWGKITIEKWGLPAPGAEPLPTQKMEIVRHPAPKCPRISGSLKIDFEDVYLRPKQRNETDFILTDAEMERFAYIVWRVQFP